MTYYISPEYKQPEDVTDASTEQDAPEKRVLHWSGDESLYPFWAVEHKSADWLRTKNRAHEPEQKTLEVNVERKTFEFASVTVGAVGKDSIAITTTVKLLVMTNPREFQKGDRLIDEAAPLPFVRKRKADETWKIDVT